VSGEDFELCQLSHGAIWSAANACTFHGPPYSSGAQPGSRTHQLEL